MCQLLNKLLQKKSLKSGKFDCQKGKKLGEFEDEIIMVRTLKLKAGNFENLEIFVNKEKGSVCNYKFNGYILKQ